MHFSLVLCLSFAMEIPSKTTFSVQNLLFHSFLRLFFFVQYLVVPVTADFNVTRYNPIENIAIDCGSSVGDKFLDDRPWVGDGSGKFSLIEQQNNNNKPSVVKAASQDSLPSSVNPFPYSTARLSYSQFTYSIPLTDGQKFIRLHFYPTKYPDFGDPSKKAFFSVKAGNFTLLSNFSVSLHAHREVTFFKEFCVNLDEGQRLNLSFTPSPYITDSYAFINGIEVVSMPTNLYYTPACDEGVRFVGQAQGKTYRLENNTALENMYRIKVGGGKEISPEEDTGMFRRWLSDDNQYLTKANPSALPVNTSIDINFSGTIQS